MGDTLLSNMAKFIARLLSTWVPEIVTTSKFIARLPAHWRARDGNY